ncbi:MAG: hypothetical protein ACYSW6_03815 [Planctomycetota bacterium]|jgi:hypothetical protein
MSAEYSHNNWYIKRGQAIGAMRLEYVTMFCLPFVPLFFAIINFVMGTQGLSQQLGGIATGYSKYLREIFHSEIVSSKETGRISLHFPLMTRFAIMLMFLMFSTMCWAGVFINLSLINAIIAPEFRLILFSYGETIAKGTMLMAGPMLGRFGEDRNINTLRLLLLIPALFPFFLLILLYLRAFILSHLKMRCRQNRHLKCSLSFRQTVKPHLSLCCS